MTQPLAVCQYKPIAVVKDWRQMVVMQTLLHQQGRCPDWLVVPMQSVVL